MSDRDTVLRVAASQVNVTECPPNSNAGLKVEEYLSSVGLAKGNPWCAAFVYWVGRFALGAKWPLPKTGGCATLGDHATAHGLMALKPQAGDVFLIYFPSLKRFAHTGFVVSVEGTTCTTIEGNTSGAGSREGWGVFQRTRTLGTKDRVIRWTVG